MSYNQYLLYTNIEGERYYSAKGGKMTTDYRQAQRFSREQVKQLASCVLTPNNNFLVTPVVDK